MTWLDDAIKLVKDFDRSRPRSRQREIGWSEAGGCRSAIGFRIEGAYADETDTWAAQRGTALHDYVFPILAAAIPGARAEVPTAYRRIPGRADLVDPSGVTDGKTTTLANARQWAARPELLRPKRIQGHGYAAGLVDAGELPEDCLVRLLVMPVDGMFADWWVFEEPFDRDLADEGANRVEWVREQVEAGEPLPKDKPYGWCESYCGFFALCRKPGEDDEGDDLPLIEDPELAGMVDAYGEANAAWSPAEATKKQLAPLLRGLRGQTPGGWKVTTGKPGEPSEKPDMDAIEADYAARGEEMPKVFVPPQAARLSVTRIKAKKDAA